MTPRCLLSCGTALAIAACARGAHLPNVTHPTLLGEWTLDFRFDSARAGGWHAASFASTRGSLQLIDSTGPGHYRSRIEVQFDSLLGRPMSCFNPLPTSTSVQRDGEHVRLLFTPKAADCGLSAAATMYGDSLVGTWEESSFVGPMIKGRFRMVRVAR